MGSKKRDELFNKARNTVERLLKFRLRSEAEIRAKLVTKRLPASVITQTVAHFRQIGLIDDQTFAHAWVASRLKKPMGVSRIRLELKKKGVAKNVIEEALENATQEYDERAVVLKLAKDRALKYTNIAPEKVKPRVYGYLQRRGFSMNSIMRAIEEL